ESETAHAPEECPVCHHKRFAIMRRWKCQVCGFVIRDTRPPEECPICHKGSEAFTEIPSHPEF
ncbi:MAG: rubredoxin-like domain-containing protein, partial [Bulleidia sp.]